MQTEALTALKVTDPAMAAAVSLVETYVGANPGISAQAAISMIGTFYETLSRLTSAADAPTMETLVSAPLVAAAGSVDAVADEVPPRPAHPAVPVSESVAPDGSYIVCLEDGARLQMLRRYLRRFNLTPEAYRERWGLPSDYPMTAPGYSARKRDEAMTVGLGTSLNKQGFNRSHLEMPRAA